ncbi:urease accessory protein UreH, partial [Candidatus Bathyarchaeota archaeon]|nr:urease accessory protein UreH [Candidatus Bathyarchaeota archaeon]
MWKSSLVGIVWGIGHTATLFLVGIIVLFLSISIPQELILSFEFLVGVVILLLGVLVLRSAVTVKIHLHHHSHGDQTHIHLHSHKEGDSHHHIHRSFILGMVHGIAGSGALMLLVLSTVESITAGITYILLFGVGSILGMLILSAVIGLPFIITA